MLVSDVNATILSPKKKESKTDKNTNKSSQKLK